jgi:hypothetical protein
MIPPYPLPPHSHPFHASHSLPLTHTNLYQHQLTVPSASVDSIHSVTTPHSVVTAREVAFTAQYLIYVTIEHVPSKFDLTAFIFLASYGQVIEGKAETQDYQFLHEGIPYMYHIYTGVYLFTVLVEKDQDITQLMALNMNTITIQGYPLQVISLSLSVSLSVCLSVSLS